MCSHVQKVQRVRIYTQKLEAHSGHRPPGISRIDGTPFIDRDVLCSVLCLRFRISGLGSRVLGLGFRVSGLGSWVSGVGARVMGLGSWISGRGYCVSGPDSQFSVLNSRVSGLESWVSGTYSNAYRIMAVCSCLLSSAGDAGVTPILRLVGAVLEYLELDTRVYIRTQHSIYENRIIFPQQSAMPVPCGMPPPAAEKEK